MHKVSNKPLEVVVNLSICKVEERVKVIQHSMRWVSSVPVNEFRRMEISILESHLPLLSAEPIHSFLYVIGNALSIKIVLVKDITTMVSVHVWLQPNCSQWFVELLTEYRRSRLM